VFLVCVVGVLRFWGFAGWFCDFLGLVLCVGVVGVSVGGGWLGGVLGGGSLGYGFGFGGGGGGGGGFVLVGALGVGLVVGRGVVLF